ncbi:MAG: hypothetical protein C4532_13170 [Candidatus Abyssobacteria bacterium SURF_17]|jgi:hypothetical protein|uniref:Uncharacterized protein n=1 Tax=Candidatus Abyssobacteria bacterium SURF_17 TaxID=2093361 RepID=A0A419EVK4_9BACT|nr:MAG: hypothetical protein C4532_13170 [Candidatus Abyssubacteria bacterium SURF_17]
MGTQMREKKTLLSMTRAFRVDIQDIQQKGAGYYSCGPFVTRYNKLLTKARELFSDEQTALLNSFDEIADTKSVDPADKMKVTQHVLIELGQLITYMESVITQEEEGRRKQASGGVSPEKDSGGNA